jgi:hypothetical protein
MNRLSRITLLLIATLFLHLIEEIVSDFRREFPLGEMSPTLFGGINVAIYTLCFATLILAIRGDPLAIPLAWIFAATMLLNGLGHIGIIVVWRRYFPGGIRPSRCCWSLHT